MRSASSQRKPIFDRSKAATKLKGQKSSNKGIPGPKGWIIKLCCMRCHTEMKEVTWGRHLSKKCSIFRPFDGKVETRLQVPEDLDSPDSFAVSAHKMKPVWRCPTCERVINSQVARELHRCSQPLTADFPFTLLPGGEKDFQTTFLRTYGALLQRRMISLDWTRIGEIESLRPVARHFGKEGWFGYGAFEFAHSKLVILETPVEGNATYILGADWREAISLTKAELRSTYRGKYFRVTHRGNWPERLATFLNRASISVGS